MPKVKITKMPGSQENGALVDRHIRNRTSDTSDSKVKHTLGESENPNVEVEGGETAIGDFNNDGYLEHFTFVGDRHTEGGVKTFVPDGTFINSDTKSLTIKDPKVLKYFGFKGKKATPAELSKRFKLNEYNEILKDPKSDFLSKKTAELMLMNNLKKLEEIAQLQESMKTESNPTNKMQDGGTKGGDDKVTKLRYSDVTRSQPIEVEGSRFQEVGASHLENFKGKDGKYYYLNTLDGTVHEQSLEVYEISKREYDQKMDEQAKDYVSEHPIVLGLNKVSSFANTVKESIKEIPVKAKSQNNSHKYEKYKPILERLNNVSELTKLKRAALKEELPYIPSRYDIYPIPFGSDIKMDSKGNYYSDFVNEYESKNKVKPEIVKPEIGNPGAYDDYTDKATPTEVPKAQPKTQTLKKAVSKTINEGVIKANPNEKFQFGGIAQDMFKDKKVNWNPKSKDTVGSLKTSQGYSFVPGKTGTFLVYKTGETTPIEVDTAHPSYKDLDREYSKYIKKNKESLINPSKYRPIASNSEEKSATEKKGVEEAPAKTSEENTFTDTESFVESPQKEINWFPQDILNLIDATGDSFNRYAPTKARDLNLGRIPYRKVDTSRILAASGESQARAKDYYTSSLDPNVAAAMVYSTTGDSTRNLFDALGTAENANVASANQVDAQNLALEQSEKVLNEQQRQEYTKAMAILNQNSDNARRELRIRRLKALNQGITNKQNHTMMSEWYPQASVDAFTGESSFSGDGREYGEPYVNAGNLSGSSKFETNTAMLSKLVSTFMLEYGLTKDEALKQAISFLNKSK
jgi:hypothetical protein